MLPASNDLPPNVCEVRSAPDSAQLLDRQLKVAKRPDEGRSLFLSTGNDVRLIAIGLRNVGARSITDIGLVPLPIGAEC